jgi:hypothetical protein
MSKPGSFSRSSFVIREYDSNLPNLASLNYQLTHDCLSGRTICAVCFASFICRRVTPVDSVLEADDLILCQDGTHTVLQAVSVLVVTVFAIGLPVTFGAVLAFKARSYARNMSGNNAAIAHRLSEDLGVDEGEAEFVIRDLTTGFLENYDFLIDAFHPRYLYWEALGKSRALPP